MSTQLATLEDVAAVYGMPLDSGDVMTANLLLNAASALVRQRVPSVDARLAAGTLDRHLVAVITAAVVARAMRNPEGIKQHTAGSVSLTYDQVLATRLVLRPEEAAQLAPPRTARSVVGTARLKAGLGCW